MNRAWLGLIFLGLAAAAAAQDSETLKKDSELKDPPKIQFSTATASAETSTAAAKGESPGLVKIIDAIVPRLSADEFSIREAASAELSKLARGQQDEFLLRRLLNERLDKSDDPEARARLRGALAELPKFKIRLESDKQVREGTHFKVRVLVRNVSDTDQWYQDFVYREDSPTYFLWVSYCKDNANERKDILSRQLPFRVIKDLETAEGKRMKIGPGEEVEIESKEVRSVLARRNPITVTLKDDYGEPLKQPDVRFEGEVKVEVIP